MKKADIYQFMSKQKLGVLRTLSSSGSPQSALGTNDFQFCHPYNDAWSAAQGITALVKEIRKLPIEPGMTVPQFW
jgi:hypothetical protein